MENNILGARLLPDLMIGNENRARLRARRPFDEDEEDFWRRDRWEREDRPALRRNIDDIFRNIRRDRND